MPKLKYKNDSSAYYAIENIHMILQTFLPLIGRDGPVLINSQINEWADEESQRTDNDIIAVGSRDKKIDAKDIMKSLEEMAK